MNSYINLILNAEGAKERLQRLFQSAPETGKNAGGKCGEQWNRYREFTAAATDPAELEFEPVLLRIRLRRLM